MNMSESVHSAALCRAHITSSHSRNSTESLETKVSSCGRQVPFQGFTHQFETNSVNIVICEESYICNNLHTNTHAAALLSYLQETCLCFSQAAAMEASSSCRPWGWGRTEGKWYFRTITSHSVHEQRLCVCYLDKDALRQKASQCVCVAGRAAGKADVELW